MRQLVAASAGQRPSSFQVGEPAPRETINKSGTNLLIEATWSNIVPQLEPDLKGEGSFDVPASHWKLISLIDGKRNIKTLAEMVDCPPAEMIKIL